MTEGPYFLEPGSIRADWRLGVGGLFVPDTGLKARSGVLHGLGVAQTTTASGSVVAGAGRCVIQDISATGGAYEETLRAAKTVDVLGSGGTAAESSPRNDLLIYEAGAATRVRMVKGTANAVPTDPALPAQAIPLARIRVKSASAYGGNEVITNADIDDLRSYTDLRGVPARVRSQPEMDALPADVTLAWRLDLQRLYVRDGGPTFTRLGPGQTFAGHGDGAPLGGGTVAPGTATFVAAGSKAGTTDSVGDILVRWDGMGGTQALNPAPTKILGCVVSNGDGMATTVAPVVIRCTPVDMVARFPGRTDAAARVNFHVDYI